MRKNRGSLQIFSNSRAQNRKEMIGTVRRVPVALRTVFFGREEKSIAFSGKVCYTFGNKYRNEEEKMEKNSSAKLNYTRTFFIGLAFMSICAFWQLYDNAVPKMLEQTFGMGETKVGIIMAMDNILAIFLLPVFGTLSDRVRSPIGRRMPFIIGGTVAAVALTVLLPFADQLKNLPLFIVTLFMLLLAMSTYRSPAVALMPDLTPKPLRSKANAVINLMGAVGGVFSLAMIFLFKPSENGTYVPVYIALAVFMALCVAVLVITVPEKKIAAQVGVYDEKESPEQSSKEPLPKNVKKSLVFLLASIVLWFFAYNAVTTAFSRYTAAVWADTTDAYSGYLMAATIFATVSYLPIGIISSKIGRKKVIMGGVVTMTAAFIIAFFLTSVNPVAYVAFALVGIGWAAINVNSFPMVVEMSKGADVGRYTGIYYTCSMAAQIATPIISGALIELVSDKYGDAAGYRTLFPYAAIFSALALITMAFVRHGDSRPEAKKSKLEYIGEVDND